MALISYPPQNTPSKKKTVPSWLNTKEIAEAGNTSTSLVAKASTTGVRGHVSQIVYSFLCSTCPNVYALTHPDIQAQSNLHRMQSQAGEQDYKCPVCATVLQPYETRGVVLQKAPDVPKYFLKEELAASGMRKEARVNAIERVPSSIIDRALVIKLTAAVAEHFRRAGCFNPRVRLNHATRASVGNPGQEGLTHNIKEAYFFVDYQDANNVNETLSTKAGINLKNGTVILPDTFKDNRGYEYPISKASIEALANRKVYEPIIPDPFQKSMVLVQRPEEHIRFRAFGGNDKAGRMVKTAGLTSQAPANWVANESIWEEAKASVDKVKYPEDSDYYAVVSTVYKNMGGKKKKAKKGDFHIFLKQHASFADATDIAIVEEAGNTSTVDNAVGLLNEWEKGFGDTLYSAFKYTTLEKKAATPGECAKCGNEHWPFQSCTDITDAKAIEAALNESLAILKPVTAQEIPTNAELYDPATQKVYNIVQQSPGNGATVKDPTTGQSFYVDEARLQTLQQSLPMNAAEVPVQPAQPLVQPAMAAKTAAYPERADQDSLVPTLEGTESGDDIIIDQVSDNIQDFSRPFREAEREVLENRQWFTNENYLPEDAAMKYELNTIELAQDSNEFPSLDSAELENEVTRQIGSVLKGRKKTAQEEAIEQVVAGKATIKQTEWKFDEALEMPTADGLVPPVQPQHDPNGVPLEESREGFTISDKIHPVDPVEADLKTAMAKKPGVVTDEDLIDTLSSEDENRLPFSKKAVRSTETPPNLPHYVSKRPKEVKEEAVTDAPEASTALQRHIKNWQRATHNINTIKEHLSKIDAKYHQQRSKVMNQGGYNEEIENQRDEIQKVQSLLGRTNEGISRIGNYIIALVERTKEVLPDDIGSVPRGTIQLKDKYMLDKITEKFGVSVEKFIAELEAEAETLKTEEVSEDIRSFPVKRKSSMFTALVDLEITLTQFLGEVQSYEQVLKDLQ